MRGVRLAGSLVAATVSGVLFGVALPADAGILGIRDDRSVRATAEHFVVFEEPDPPFSDFDVSEGLAIAEILQTSEIGALGMSGQAGIYSDGGGGVEGEVVFDVTFTVGGALDFSLSGSIASGWNDLPLFDTPEDRVVRLTGPGGALFAGSARHFAVAGRFLPGAIYRLELRAGTKADYNPFEYAEWSFGLTATEVPEPGATGLLAVVLALLAQARARSRHRARRHGAPSLAIEPEREGAALGRGAAPGLR